MPIEPQNGDHNLYASAATVFSKTATGDCEIELEISVGDGTKNLNVGVGTLTLKITNDGMVVGGDGQAVYKGTQTRVQLRSGKIFVSKDNTLSVTLQSSNSNDADVDVTVTPRGTGVVNSSKLYVSKSGSDSNGGHSWSDAKLTINNGAIAVAATGDTILIGPGTFEESVDSTALSDLVFRGSGLGTVITSGAARTFQIADRTSLYDMKIDNTLATGMGLHIWERDDVSLYRVNAFGAMDGVVAVGTKRLYAEDCHFLGKYDGINLLGSFDWVLKDTICETNGTYNETEVDCRAILASTWGSGQMSGGRLIAQRSNETARRIIGFASDNANSNFLLKGVEFIVEQYNGAATGAVHGVSGSITAGSVGNVHLVDCKISTRQAGSGEEWHLKQNSGILSVSPSVQYDTAKTNGTITLTGFDPANDTVDIGKISGDADSVIRLKRSVDAMQTGVVVADGTNSTTEFDTDLTTKNENYYGDGDGGLVIAFIDGTANQGQTRRIIASVTSGAETRITLESALDGVPTVGDAFVVLGRITELS